MKKLIWVVITLLILAGIYFCYSTLNTTKTVAIQQDVVPQKDYTPVLYTAPSQVTQLGLLEETNAIRYQYDGDPLALDPNLNITAQEKCEDMVARNYWSHNTPDGVEPWALFKKHGVEYKYAGENLAYGFKTSSEVITGWFNSPGHRKNLLSYDYQDVGFGICTSNNFVGTGRQIIVVQHFRGN